MKNDFLLKDSFFGGEVIHLRGDEIKENEMKLLSDARIDEIFNSIYDVFRRHNFSEQEVNKIIKEAGIEYILSLKKRLKPIETKSDD